MPCSFHSLAPCSCPRGRSWHSDLTHTVTSNSVASLALGWAYTSCWHSDGIFWGRVRGWCAVIWHPQAGVAGRAWRHAAAAGWGSACFGGCECGSAWYEFAKREGSSSSLEHGGFCQLWVAGAATRVGFLWEWGTVTGWNAGVRPSRSVGMETSRSHLLGEASLQSHRWRRDPPAASGRGEELMAGAGGFGCASVLSRPVLSWCPIPASRPVPSQPGPARPRLLGSSSSLGQPWLTSWSSLFYSPLPLTPLPDKTRKLFII